MNELVRALAYAFQATGRRRLLEEDFVRLLAHERRWFPPSQVRSMVQAARAQSVLRNAGANAFELAEESKGVVLGVDYRPDPGGLESALRGSPAPAASLPLFQQIVRAIAEATHESDPSVVAAVNLLQQETGGLVQAEVAALWLGRLRDVDVSRFQAEVADRLAAVDHGAGHK